MRRTALLLTTLLFALLAACATYRQDLARARAHYDKNEFEAALALFRVLEPDMDSFSAAEKTQYAYARGMTDYRLASLANAGTAVADPKGAFRSHARHWLGVARAIEKESPGGLTADEKQRVEEALVDLNAELFGGGADAAPVSSASPKAGPAKADPVKADKP